jgi:hypothetical protein
MPISAIVMGKFYRISIFNILESSSIDDEERMQFIPVAVA